MRFFRIAVVLVVLIWHQPTCAQAQNLTAGDLIAFLNQRTDFHVALNVDVSPLHAIQIRNSQGTGEALIKKCLTGTDLTYDLIGSNVIIRHRRHFQIVGFVSDKNSGEALIGAHIFSDRYGTSTNNTGYFQLSLPEGPSAIVCSYLGYSLDTLSLDVQADTRIQLELETDFSLPSVLVASRPSEMMSAPHLSKHSGLELPVSDLASMPSLNPGLDLIRYLQYQAGVASGADGQGGLHVRGGSSDQNLYLLDGVPIFNPFHMLGLSSVFNSDAVQHAHFHKGAFSAKHGGRLSSVLDVSLRDGSSEALKATAGISRNSAQGVVHGPLGAGATFLLSASHSMPTNGIGQLIAPENAEHELDLSFRDFFAKLSLRPSDRDRIYTNLYLTSDQLQESDAWGYNEESSAQVRVQEEHRFDWGNTAGSLRWFRAFSHSLFGNLSIFRSTFNYQSRSRTSTHVLDSSKLSRLSLDRADFRSQVSQLGTRISFDKLLARQRTLKFGIEANRNVFVPGIVAYEDEETPTTGSFGTQFDTLNFKSHTASIYAEYAGIISEKWNLSGGLRLNALFLDSGIYMALRPRLHASFTYGDGRSIHLSLGQMQQNQHIISTLDNGYPNELWVPASKRHLPQTVSIIDFMHQWSSYKRSISLGGFYKKMNRLLAFTPEPNFLTPGRLDNVDASAWEDDVIQGEGHAYGLEGNFQLKTERLLLAGSYTFARSFRFFDELYKGYEIPYGYDRPHSTNFLGQWQISPTLQCALGWQFGSGTSVPLHSGAWEVYDETGEFAFDVEVPQSDVELIALRSYHRLDASISAAWTGDKVQHQLKIGVSNAYDRLNPSFANVWRDLDFGQVVTETGLPRQLQVSYHVRIL